MGNQNQPPKFLHLYNDSTEEHEIINPGQITRMSITPPATGHPHPTVIITFNNGMQVKYTDQHGAALAYFYTRTQDRHNRTIELTTTFIDYETEQLRKAVINHIGKMQGLTQEEIFFFYAWLTDSDISFWGEPEQQQLAYLKDWKATREPQDQPQDRHKTATTETTDPSAPYHYEKATRPPQVWKYAIDAAALEEGQRTATRPPQDRKEGMDAAGPVEGHKTAATPPEAGTEQQQRRNGRGRTAASLKRKEQ